MSHITHPYFGTLDSNAIKEDVDVIWEQEVTFQELSTPVEFHLWAAKDQEISIERLDLFEQFIKHFPEKDQEARQQLKAYLEEDSYYMDFHIEELDLEVGNDINSFVAAMQTHRVALWNCLDEDIVVDYMIDPEQSDEILVVRFNIDGSFNSIDWES